MGEDDETAQSGRLTGRKLRTQLATDLVYLEGME